jgi:hypothetical protein
MVDLMKKGTMKRGNFVGVSGGGGVGGGGERISQTFMFINWTFLAHFVLFGVGKANFVNFLYL